MFIVIEGTDASGKSTLVSEVQKQLAVKFPKKEIEFYHKSKPKEMSRRWVLYDYVTSIEKADWSQRVAIADRWHWGEITYASVKRPETGTGDGYGLLGKAGWRWTELFLKSRGVAQFWLYQPLDVITRRLNARGDDYIQANELEEILKFYELAAANSAGLAGRLTPSPDSLDAVSHLASHVISRAEIFDEDAQALAKFPEYIGQRFPRVLLVGDTRNITKKYGEETILPFMPVDGNSGEFLLTALESDKWKTMGIVNVNDMSSERFEDLWCTLRRPPVVALGRLAERGIRHANIPDYLYTVTSHPQHVRRFLNSKKEEYGQAITRLSTKKDKDDPWILR
jgi:thymidylate kinase